MSKLGDELDEQRRERDAQRAIARGIAEGQFNDLTPEQIRECAIRYLTRINYFKPKE